MSPIEAHVLDRDHSELAHEVRVHGPFDLPRDVIEAIHKIGTHVPEVPEPKAVEPRYTLAPRFNGVTEHTPKPHSLRTSFWELSPRGQDVVSFQRGLLSMSGGGVITGHNEVVTSGSPTVVNVFIQGDRTSDVMGGRPHRNEAGQAETVVSVPIMSTGMARAIPQRRR